MPLIIVLVWSLLGLAQTVDQHPSAKPRGRAVFELNVKHSDVMKLGSYKLVCNAAFSVIMHREGKAKFTGVDIFFARSAGDGSTPKSVKELKEHDYANVNLMLDATGTLYQVNMTVVVPGSTVARTVAWKVEDLAKYFSNASVKDNRVVLKSKGVFEDAASESERARMAWDVDIDIPVTPDADH